MVEHWTENPCVGGSNPLLNIKVLIAQRLEHMPDKHKVSSSILLEHFFFMYILQINTNFIIETRPLSVIEACSKYDKKMPHFCYHPLLSLEGNCRSCVIEIDKIAKPQASCCLPISNNIKIYTDSPLVQKARENISEFLLINHPLDCPVCDQGGECDLQDQILLFGLAKSRYTFKKKSVSNKYYGPLIKTVMNRCINCTRCVRYNTEILNMPTLGNLNRGKFSEIGFYQPYKTINSEFTGNVIDICPVGALALTNYLTKNRIRITPEKPSPIRTLAKYFIAWSDKKLHPKIKNIASSVKEKLETKVINRVVSVEQKLHTKVINKIAEIDKKDKKDILNIISKQPKNFKYIESASNSFWYTEFFIFELVNGKYKRVPKIRYLRTFLKFYHGISETVSNPICRILVGALTSKPYNFKSRTMDLKSITSLDLFDSIGTNITIESSKKEVIRILPRYNSLINDFWISDRIRFCIDSFNFNRLKTPAFKLKQKIKKTYWTQSTDFFKYILNIHSLKNIQILFENTLDLNSLIVLKIINLKIKNINFLPYTKNSKNFTSMFLFNSYNKIKYIDLSFCFGVNPKLELGTLYLKLLKEQQKKNFKFFIFGYKPFLTIPYIHLGYTQQKLNFFYFGKLKNTLLLKTSILSLFLINSKLFERKDSKNIYNLLNYILEKNKNNNNLISTIHNKSNQVSNLILGYSNKIKNNLKINYSLLNFPQQINKKIIHITQRSQNVKDLSFFLSFPSSIYIEQFASFINSDGLLQKIQPCYKPFFDSKKDSTILKKIFNFNKINNFLFSYHKLYKLVNKKPLDNSIFKKLFNNCFLYNTINLNFFIPQIENYYTYTNSICKNSYVLYRYSKYYKKSHINFN